MATSRCVRPTCPALLRSTLISIAGVVHDLMNVDVGRARNLRDPGGDLARDFVIGGGVAAHHLQVDGRGQAEIQDLVGDIGGFKEKDHVGELLVEAFAKAVGVFGGGAVLPGLREIRMSPSLTPSVGLSPKARLKPPLGMPMLSMMFSISFGRYDLADFVFDLGEDLLRSFRGACRRARGRAGAWRRNPRSGRNRGRREEPDTSEPATKRKKPPSTGSR